uniref:Uncharacterized protein n=1 Tax=Cannabis sativa TaxID=3483 RepID=A0A803PUE0_CANSA
MTSKTICFCIPSRKKKQGKEPSTSHGRSKKREPEVVGPAGTQNEGNYDGATTSSDAAGMAAVMVTTAATVSAMHANDGGSTHGGGDGEGLALGVSCMNLALSLGKGRMPLKWHDDSPSTCVIAYLSVGNWVSSTLY